MGQLYILDFTRRAGGVDITKARRGHHRDRGPSLLDVHAYNATPMGVRHPKAADGRFTDGHPSVDMLGDMPDFVGQLSDRDLKRAEDQARSLARALMVEGSRRAAGAKASKPLKATRAAKPIPADLAARVEQIKKRPIPSDLTYLDAELPKLTVAQLKELGSFGNWAETGYDSKGGKAQVVSDVKNRLAGRLMGEAVTHQGLDRERGKEYDRRRKLADERGDREEYAALVAGFGIGGTGAGLPPEKVWGGIESITPERLEDVIMGNNAGAAMHARNKARRREVEQSALDAERERIAAGRPYVPDAALMAENERMASLASALRRHEGDGDSMLAALKAEKLTPAQLRRLADEMNITIPPAAKSKAARELYITKTSAEYSRRNGPGGVTRDPAKPLKTTSAKAKPNDGSALSSSWMDGTFAADIDVVIKNPKAGSAELLTSQLGRLKVSELGELAAKHDVKLLGRTKKEKIDNFVASTVQNKLNSQAAGSLGAGQADVKRLEDRVARLAVALDTESRKRKSGGSRIMSAKEGKLKRELTEAKRNRDAAMIDPELAAGAANIQGQHLESPTDSPLQRQMRERFTGKANLERLAGGPIKPGEFGPGSGAPAGPRYLDTPHKAADEIRAMRRDLKRPEPDRSAEIKSTREALEEARANLVSQYGEDPDRWPEARQDREVEAYYDLRDKLRRLEG